MTHTEMIRRMVELSGNSARGISAKIGRSSGFIGQMLYRGSVPGVDLLSEIADACGFSLLAIGHGVSFSLNGAGLGPHNFAPLYDEGEPITDGEFESLLDDEFTPTYGVEFGEGVPVDDAQGGELVEEIEMHIKALQSCVARLRRASR